MFPRGTRSERRGDAEFARREILDSEARRLAAWRGVIHSACRSARTAAHPDHRYLSMSAQSWMVIDQRTGKRMSAASFLTRESAEWHITEWQDRGERGGRPDISREKLLNMVVVPDDHT
jgi:hypothetical protein